jgi:hypothetical protein
LAAGGESGRAPTVSPSPEEVLAALLARLPDLTLATGIAGPPPREMICGLRDLIRDAGREMKRLRNLPRQRTAPIARFRQACRDLLAGLRGMDRAHRRMETARRRIDSLR